MVSYKKKFLKYKLKYEKLIGGSNHNINIKDSDFEVIIEEDSEVVKYISKIKNETEYYSDNPDNHDNDESHFTIEFNSNKTMDMTIYINENLRRRGLAKKLIKNLCERIQNEPGISRNTLLFIDTDASWTDTSTGQSVSFWSHIGMVENPLYEVVNSTLPEGENWVNMLSEQLEEVEKNMSPEAASRIKEILQNVDETNSLEDEGIGYEQVITFEKLCKYASADVSF